MRNYETVFILDPALSDERAAQEVERATSIIQRSKGEVIDVQRWGKRKLAYDIKKRREGIYTVVRFRSDGAAVTELERSFRLTEPVLRFMTVVDDSLPSHLEGGVQEEPRKEPEALRPEERRGGFEAGERRGPGREPDSDDLEDDEEWEESDQEPEEESDWEEPREERRKER